MNVTVELMNASSETGIPPLRDFQHWTETVLKTLRVKKKQLEVCIRIVDEKESAFLNESFRQKKGATNVLSFPFPHNPVDELNLLGDLAICAPLVKEEARAQKKPADAHWAHLTIHGLLHLNGYDHEEKSAAVRMENLEIKILHSLDYGNPYEPVE